MQSYIYIYRERVQSILVSNFRIHFRRYVPLYILINSLAKKLYRSVYRAFLLFHITVTALTSSTPLRDVLFLGGERREAKSCPFPGQEYNRYIYIGTYTYTYTLMFWDG